MQSSLGISCQTWASTMSLNDLQQVVRVLGDRSFIITQDFMPARGSVADLTLLSAT